MPRLKVMIGMSGGVDSAVAAAVLQQQGHQVEALFMKNWEEDDTDQHCSAAQDLSDAQSVCQQLGIKLHTVNFSGEYWDRVFAHFLAEYRAGRTPNPDVLCNREIKFAAFLEHARTLGADVIATGHYARVARTDDGTNKLLKGVDGNKDQSYFLHLLDQAQLEQSLFPIGGMEKSAVRQQAVELGFGNAAKKDSTGICFIGERRFRDFLSRYVPGKPGDIRTPDGQVIGTHHGVMYYTLGQRQGLGIGGCADAAEEPWYVVSKDVENNVLVAAQGHDHPLLFHRALTGGHTHWISGPPQAARWRCMAKTRYRQADQACEVSIDLSNPTVCQVVFEQPQRAMTPGQSVVFYAGEVCLGGAIIEAVID